MSSLLSRTLGQVHAQDEGNSTNRRTSGGGNARASPYSRPEGSWKHDMYSNKPNASAASDRSYTTPKQDQGKSAKLQITNVHYEVSERELELLFAQIGPIASGPKIKSLSFRLTNNQFDRSGRSLGVAWVTFTSEDHAAQAKEAFDGALAKGQEIKVEFDYHLNRGSERGQLAPGSLIARLEEPASNRRRSAGAGGPPRDAPRGPRVSTERGVGAPVRGAARGGGRGGARGGREPRAKREPKTQDDLDAELEAFMSAPAPKDAGVVAGTSAESNAAPDVEMA
ncbi:hypothetical protein BCR35DRAFT_221547 [Leucosporidium creatinivorum]|uniref:RRM domain-containing protein n=1 Tax=Leucosporidium creatinivorum TaxID=106004 RepID=A0A1Y2D8G8_9BASI|nr:hypothetical protein BCR35DRAFT_221547 [Leucosporidium creatinivorum]